MHFRDQLVALLPSLRAFARGLCGWRDMADDMVQDAMLRGWAARASFTPGTNFRAWMFMILRNQFYTTLRKDKRMTSRSEEHTSELQSLMRISYAVFCLKKTTNTRKHNTLKQFT